MGMTVGCAKCHDHMFDPIPQKDFYAMKALFDPLVIKKQTLATPAELVVYGKQLEEYDKLRIAAEEPINGPDRALSRQALRRSRRHAAGRRPGRHQQSRKSSARRPSKRSPTIISRFSASTPTRSKRSCRKPTRRPTRNCAPS